MDLKAHRQYALIIAAGPKAFNKARDEPPPRRCRATRATIEEISSSISPFSFKSRKIKEKSSPISRKTPDFKDFRQNRRSFFAYFSRSRHFRRNRRKFFAYILRTRRKAPEGPNANNEPGAPDANDALEMPETPKAPDANNAPERAGRGLLAGRAQCAGKHQEPRIRTIRLNRLNRLMRRTQTTRRPSFSAGGRHNRPQNTRRRPRKVRSRPRVNFLRTARAGPCTGVSGYPSS